VAFKDIQSVIAKAGNNAIKGPIYGINSIIHAISAKVNFSSIFTQKSSIIRNQI
jgi:hypothetical protein